MAISLKLSSRALNKMLSFQKKNCLFSKLTLKRPDTFRFHLLHEFNGKTAL